MEHEQQEQKQERKSDSDRFWKFATVALIVILAVVAFRDNGGSPTAPTGGAVIDGTGQPAAVPVDMAKLVDDDAVLGKKDASVTIVEFSDYECPFCVRFHTETWPQLKKNYIDTGKVKFVYRDFPLGFHQNAQKAAEAAECAGAQGKFWEMHDLLFTKGVAGGINGFKQYAQTLSLDTAKFNKCLDSGEKASEVQKDEADGAAAGIQGTPGFFVNGVPVSGAQPYSVFQKIIDAALAK